MDSTRLFNLLVLHGSLLAVGACDDDEGEPPVGEETGMDPATDDDDEPATTASSSSTSPEPDDTGEGPGSSSGEDDPSTSASSTGEGEDESEASTGTPGEESSEGPPLECSEPAAADDTCGCPCCWAGDPTCINTDETCCAGFTDLCTQP